MDGLLSIEDLRDGSGKPIGGALRAFDRERRLWSDRWIPFRSGLVQDATWGSFAEGVGTFTAEDTHNDKPLLVRGVWRRLSKDEVMWEQACSLDNGATWELNWHMLFVRA
ncbi:MAG: hypothetical protein HC853_11000 [Anaerolineae bacterium]|nr:hypothetical protein [Anaerolineae bacterium]